MMHKCLIHVVVSFLLLALVATCTSAQSDTDIYLFDVVQKNGEVSLSNGRNVTERQGYDNQPHFHPSEPIIFFSSFDNDGLSDIKQFNFETGETKNFTTTDDREYSPTVTPDGKFISCIIQREDDAQNLGKYPIDGGDAETLIDDLTVGYHAWASDHELILFVLGPTMDLVWHDLKSGESEVLAKNIGRALHKIPGENAMSYVQKRYNQLDSSQDEWTIKRLDIATKKATDIMETMKGREDLAWLNDKLILATSDDGLFSLSTGSADEKPEWKLVDLGEIKLTGVTRIAVSSDKKHVAIVADDQ